MPVGSPFSDVVALRELLVSDPSVLAREFTGHLVTFATGAEISFADRALVEAIVLRAKKNNYGLRTLLHEVIQSELFLGK
jgi:hypothetical protein